MAGNDAVVVTLEDQGCGGSADAAAAPGSQARPPPCFSSNTLSGPVACGACLQMRVMSSDAVNRRGWMTGFDRGGLLAGGHERAQISPSRARCRRRRNAGVAVNLAGGRASKSVLLIYLRSGAPGACGIEQRDGCRVNRRSLARRGRGVAMRGRLADQRKMAQEVPRCTSGRGAFPCVFLPCGGFMRLASGAPVPGRPLNRCRVPVPPRAAGHRDGRGPTGRIWSLPAHHTSWFAQPGEDPV